MCWCWCKHARGGRPVVQKRKVELTEVEDAVVHGVPEAAAEAGSSEAPRKKKKKNKQDAATEDGVPATSEMKKKKKADRLAALQAPKLHLLLVLAHTSMWWSISLATAPRHSALSHAVTRWP